MEEKSKKSSMKITGKIAKIRQPQKTSGGLKSFLPKNIPLKLMSTGFPVKRVLTQFEPFTPSNIEYIANDVQHGFIDFCGADEGLCVGRMLFNKRTAQCYRICRVVHKVLPIGKAPVKKNKKGDTFLVISPTYQGFSK